MKKLIISSLLAFLCFAAYACPQESELLIIGEDTIAIYQLPFKGLKKSVLNRFLENKAAKGRFVPHDVVYTTNNWRGYRCVWKVIDDKLYLTDIFECFTSAEIFKESFGEHYDGEKVFAYWFSSDLIIPKGHILKQNSVFGVTYSKEEHLVFKDGVVIGKKQVDNYIPVKDGISRKHNWFDYNNNCNPMKKAIVDALNNHSPGKIDLLLCSDRYYITIGPKGIITKIEFPDKEYCFRRCLRQIKRPLKKLRFDIVLWNGKPYKEVINIEFNYDDSLKMWLLR